MGFFGNPLSSLLGSLLLETIVSNQCAGLEEAATDLPAIFQCQYMGVEQSAEGAYDEGMPLAFRSDA